MFFRFGTAVVLIVIVSLLGIALEKRILSVKRTISLQHYRFEQLHEQRNRLRVRSEQLGAPSRLIDAIEGGSVELELVRKDLDRPDAGR
jgi:hypothetical protein